MSVPTLPSFVVSEQTSEHFLDIEQVSKSQKKKSSMAVRVGRGAAGRRRGRPVANAEVLETMQQIQARLEAIELGHPRDPKDVNEPKAEEEEGGNVEITPKMRFFKSVLGYTSKSRLEVSAFAGGLNPEELIDWINEMNKCFDYEEMGEDKRVKFAVTRLKGHATLLWDGVQAERRRAGKQPIKNWNRMVAKMRGKFFPIDYKLSLFKQMQNLKQRLMIVKEYTKEFYKVSIRAGQIQDTTEKIARYVNCLRMEIQDEISILSPKIVEEAYQMALKAKEKLLRKQNSKGRGTFRGKGSQGGRGISTTPRYGDSNSSPQHAHIKGDASGRRSSYRGRGGRSRGREVRCYRCNKLGHRAYECPE